MRKQMSKIEAKLELDKLKLDLRIAEREAQTERLKNLQIKYNYKSTTVERLTKQVNEVKEYIKGIK